MNRLLKNVISVIFSFVRFSCLKLFMPFSFYFHPIQRFSPNTQVEFMGKGKIILKKGVRAHSRVRLRTLSAGIIEIGANTSINYGCMFFSMSHIKVGNGVEFGPNVLVYDHDHDYGVVGGLKASKFKVDNVVIGDECWVGANTIILRGTVLGNNCVVGAGSVLKGEYPPNSLIIQKRVTDVSSFVF